MQFLVQLAKKEVKKLKIKNSKRSKKKQKAKNKKAKKSKKAYVKVVYVTSSVSPCVQRRLRTKKGFLSLARLLAGTTLGVVSPKEGEMAKGGKPTNHRETGAAFSLFSFDMKVYFFQTFHFIV